MISEITIGFVLATGPCTAIGVSADIYNIQDSQMNTTSYYLEYYAYNGRLNGSSGWCAGSRDDYSDDYLQIDMGAEYSVCAVETQGKSSGSYLTSYQLSFSSDGQTWTTYQEDGQDKVFNYFAQLLRSEHTRGHVVGTQNNDKPAPSSYVPKGPS